MICFYGNLKNSLESIIQLRNNLWHNSYAKTLLKVIFSAGLLAFILTRINLSALIKSVSKCQSSYLLFSFLFVNLCMVVSALKWRPLLIVQGIRAPFTSLLSLYYIGLFANNFLPSGIGGDALRIYGAAKISDKTTEAAASVILERLLASLALGLTASLALLFVSFVSLPDGIKYQVYWCVGIIVGVCFFIPAALFRYSFLENTFSKHTGYHGSINAARFYQRTWYKRRNVRYTLRLCRC